MTPFPLVFALCVSLVSANVIPSIPFLLWSEENLGGRNDVAHKPVGYEQMAGLIRRLTDPNYKDVDLVLVLTLDGLYTHALSRDLKENSFLEKARTQSKSFESARDISFSPLQLREILGVSAVSQQKLMETLASWKQTPGPHPRAISCSLDVEPLVVVDQFLSTLNEKMKATFGKKYVVILTGVREELAVSRRLQTNTTTPNVTCEEGYIYSKELKYCFTHYVKMTPEILTGLVFGFFLIAVTIIGLYTLGSIQTPTKMATVPLPRGKEY